MLSNVRERGFILFRKIAVSTTDGDCKHFLTCFCFVKRIWTSRVPSELNIRQGTSPEVTYKLLRQKGRALTQSYDKAPTPTEMSKGQSDNTNNGTKKFD